MITKVTGLVLLMLLTSGCYTCIQAPGAKGTVIDATNGTPVRGAHIVRPYIAPGIRVPPPGFEPVSVLSGRKGAFDLLPTSRTQFAFMYVRNPESISGSFLVYANGYETNEVKGVATAKSRWRVDLGTVGLTRQ